MTKNSRKGQTVTPGTMTLGMKIGMGISGFMLACGIVTTVIIFVTAVILCFEGTKKIKSVEEYVHDFSPLFLLASAAILLFLGSIAVKIHTWMWAVR